MELMYGFFVFGGIGAFFLSFSLRNKLIRVAGLLWLLGTFIPLLFIKNSLRNISPLSVICWIAGGVLITIYFFQEKKKEKSDAIEKRNDMLMKFYHRCISEGIEGCISERDKQKATLIANDMKITFSDIIVLFNESKELVDEARTKTKARELSILKMQEENACKEQEKYSNYLGRDKRIAMLTEIMNVALSKREQLRSRMSNLDNAITQKEHDWAILGGVADGIAGPVAGAVTAIETQLKNAEIRAQNDANRKIYAPAFTNMLDADTSYGIQARECKEQIDKAKILLVKEDCIDECFSHLVFDKTSYSVSETGTITVITKVIAEEMIIFDTISATIDGVIVAEIYDGSDLVGSAKMVLPVFGVKDEYVQIIGLCLFAGKSDKIYRIEFKPYKLWAME